MLTRWLVAILISVATINCALGNDLNSDLWRRYYDSKVEYETNYREFALHYMNGILAGLTWANLEAGENGKPLFCSPEGKFSFSNDEAVKIFEDEMARKQGVSEKSPLSLVMLNGLANKYPCK